MASALLATGLPALVLPPPAAAVAGHLAGTSISGDGATVAFASNAATLVPGDGNATDDVFVREVRSGAVSLASVATSGGPANGPSTRPSLSGDGRRVAFQTAASNVVPGDTDGLDDIVVRDLKTRTTQLVSVPDPSGTAEGPAHDASINRTGTRVAFVTSGRLSSRDTDSSDDVYVRDLVAGTTTLVSIARSGKAITTAASSPAISGDGWRVAFVADGEVLVRDLKRGVTLLASDPDAATLPGTVANGPSGKPAISGDGRFVAFGSDASNLVVGDTNGTRDVFRHDLRSGATVRVSTGAHGPASGFSDQPAMTPDGARVAFTSLASNLSDGDTNGTFDVFVRDLAAGTTALASLSGTQRQSRTASTLPALPASGRKVVFQSADGALTARDLDGADDVYLRDLRAQTTVRISQPAAVTTGTGCSWSPSDLVAGLPSATGGGAVDVASLAHGPLVLTPSSVRASQAGVGARFGAAVTAANLDGSGCASLAVGAPGAGSDGAGRVYVVLAGPSGPGTGRPTIAVAAPAGARGDGFGSALALTRRRDEAGVAIPGRYDLWVGVPGRSVDGNAGAGAVEHFGVAVPTTGTSTGSGTGTTVGTSAAPTVTHLATLTQDSPGVPGDAEAGDAFGAVLATEDAGRAATLAVGVPGEAVGTAAAAGMITLFRVGSGGGPSGATGFTQDTEGISGTAEAGDRFGASLALSGINVLVGAPGEDLPGAVDGGYVHHLRATGTELGEAAAMGEGDLLIPDWKPAKGDAFGTAVGFAQAGSVAVIGAPGRAAEGRESAGVVYWRDLLPGQTAVAAWEGHLLPGPGRAGDRLGAAIAVRTFAPEDPFTTADQRVAVGAPGAGAGGKAGSGLVYDGIVEAAASDVVVVRPAAPVGDGGYGGVLAGDTTGL